MFGRRRKLEKFAEWVARELFPDDDSTFDSDLFTAIACRKLERLGYVNTIEVDGQLYFCLKE